MPNDVLAAIRPVIPPNMPITTGTAKFLISAAAANCIVAVTKPPNVPRSIHKNISDGGRPFNDTIFPAAVNITHSQIWVINVITHTIIYFDKNTVEYFKGLVYIYCRQLLKFSYRHKKAQYTPIRGAKKKLE